MFGPFLGLQFFESWPVIRKWEASWPFCMLYTYKVLNILCFVRLENWETYTFSFVFWPSTGCFGVSPSLKPSIGISTSTIGLKEIVPSRERQRHQTSPWVTWGFGFHNPFVKVMVEPTHLKKMSQNERCFPQIGLKMENIWNHHPVYAWPTTKCEETSIFLSSPTMRST